MIDFDFLIVFILILMMNYVLLNSLAKKHSFFDKGLMNRLYWFHVAFFVIYFIYGLVNRSDSYEYYFDALNIWESWGSQFRSGTVFISFFAAPLVNIGLSFLSVSLIFSWMGYIGFVYAYLYFKESIPIDVKVFGRFDLLTLLLFLPNMHFWTASIGKGSMVFMGLMIFTYAVKFPQKRIFTLIVGGFLYINKNNIEHDINHVLNLGYRKVKTYL